VSGNPKSRTWAGCAKAAGQCLRQLLAADAPIFGQQLPVAGIGAGFLLVKGQRQLMIAAAAAGFIGHPQRGIDADDDGRPVGQVSCHKIEQFGIAAQ
jgi:hypothetical protein